MNNAVKQMEAGFELLGKLRECQEIAQLLHGELYQDKISTYIKDINKQSTNGAILTTVLIINQRPETSSPEQIMYLAAAMEIFDQME